MKLTRSLPALALLLPLLGIAAEPAYFNDFEKAQPGQAPENVMIMAGDFKVAAGEGGAKFLELPGDPLDTFGLLFGPSVPPGGSASAKFYGTKQGRKLPAFGLSLGGVGGYRLQLSAAKKALEIIKGDETRATQPFTWEAGTWISLHLQVRKEGDHWIVEGKAWPANTPEPAAWTITLQAPEPPPAGRPAIWGTPYSGTPIRFDDLRLDAPNP